MDPTTWLLDRIVHWFPPADDGFEALYRVIEALDLRAPQIAGLVVEALDRGRLPEIRALALEGSARWHEYDPALASPDPLPVWWPGDPREPAWSRVFGQITEPDHAHALMTMWFNSDHDLVADGIPIQACIPYVASIRAVASQICDQLAMDYVELMHADATAAEVEAFCERCRIAGIVLAPTPNGYQVLHVSVGSSDLVCYLPAP